MTDHDAEEFDLSKERIAKAKRVKNYPLDKLPDLEGNTYVNEPLRTRGNVWKEHPYASPEFKTWQKAMREALQTLSHGVHILSWYPRLLYCKMCPANTTRTNQILVQYLMPLCPDHIDAVKKFKPNETREKWVRHRWHWDEDRELWYQKSPVKGGKRSY